jgi:hypothetical protein
MRAGEEQRDRRNKNQTIGIGHRIKMVVQLHNSNQRKQQAEKERKEKGDKGKKEK